MRFFLDSANLNEIREAADIGIIAGVTTNPSLVAKEGHKDFHGTIQTIASMIDGPVSAEVISLDWASMVQEADTLASLAHNVVIKIPMTKDGLRAVHLLSEKGIKTNVTLIFSATQALLAARAGASYVSPFVGRLDDISMDGMQLVSDTAEIFFNHEIDTEIIAASVRHPIHVIEAAKAGAHIATVPWKVMEQMMKHPLTDAGIKKFMDDWKAVSGK